MFLSFVEKEAVQPNETQCAPDMLCFTAAECWFWQSIGRCLLDNLVEPHLLLYHESCKQTFKGVAFPHLIYSLLTTATLHHEMNSFAITCSLKSKTSEAILGGWLWPKQKQ